MLFRKSLSRISTEIALSELPQLFATQTQSQLSDTDRV